MSRNLQQPQSSRYKISSPQPLITPEQRYQEPSYSPFPPQTSAQPPYPPSDAYRSSSPAPRLSNEYNRSGASSPSRPARSQRRDVPSQHNPPSQRSKLAPLQTDLRRPANEPSSSRTAMPVSPVSPVSALPYNDGNSNNGNNALSDPWARDRDQRSELRAQTGAAIRQATLPLAARQASGGPGNDKLRNVVGAFMSASKREEAPARRPGRSELRERARKERKEEVWDVSSEGGKFAEIDCKWSF